MIQSNFVGVRYVNVLIISFHCSQWLQILCSTLCWSNHLSLIVNNTKQFCQQSIMTLLLSFSWTVNRFYITDKPFQPFFSPGTVQNPRGQYKKCTVLIRCWHKDEVEKRVFLEIETWNKWEVLQFWKLVVIVWCVIYLAL